MRQRSKAADVFFLLAIKFNIIRKHAPRFSYSRSNPFSVNAHGHFRGQSKPVWFLFIQSN